LIGGGLVGLVWWAFLLVIGWISSRLVGFSCNASLGPHGVWFGFGFALVGFSFYASLEPLWLGRQSAFSPGSQKHMDAHRSRYLVLFCQQWSFDSVIADW